VTDRQKGGSISTINSVKLSKSQNSLRPFQENKKKTVTISEEMTAVAGSI